MNCRKEWQFITWLDRWYQSSLPYNLIWFHLFLLWFMVLISSKCPGYNLIWFHLSAHSVMYELPAALCQHHDRLHLRCSSSFTSPSRLPATKELQGLCGRLIPSINEGWLIPQKSCKFWIVYPFIVWCYELPAALCQHHDTFKHDATQQWRSGWSLFSMCLGYKCRTICNHFEDLWRQNFNSLTNNWNLNFVLGCPSCHFNEFAKLSKKSRWQ